MSLTNNSLNFPKQNKSEQNNQSSVDIEPSGSILQSPKSANEKASLIATGKVRETETILFKKGMGIKEAKN